MKLLFESSEKIKYRYCYNIYPIFNEIHPTADLVINTNNSSKLFLDDYYGRIFNKKYIESNALYGKSSKMDFYVNIKGLELVNEYRVPYRKIPIYKVDSIYQIKTLYETLIENNKEFDILLRGQTKTYFIKRDQRENNLFYGQCNNIKEPSFLPTHLRNNFDDLFIKSMWYNHAAILLNDIGYDYEHKHILTKSEIKNYWNDINYLRNSPLFPLFSLGIAQHYGLPSIGLDLTNNITVASWFALNKMSINKSGYTNIYPIYNFKDFTPIIFVFKCPKNTVFNYESVKPKIFPIARPDKQNAWFGHVGWGDAKNQLGSYLMCGFALSEKYADSVRKNLPIDLFPPISKDPILKFFIKIRERYEEGEVKRAFENIYYTI